MHVSGPNVSLNFPAAHSVQASQLGQVYPVLHWQLIVAGLLLGDCALAGHAEHSKKDKANLYLPALQAVHLGNVFVST